MVTPGPRVFARVIAAGAVAALACTTMAPSSAAPFAGERFAPISNMSDAPPLDVQSVTVTPVDGGTVRFGLQFSGPFASPSDGYRVSVSVGDPTARRTRWSLAVVGGQVVGVVETGDGVQWTQVSTAPAELDGAQASASIDAVPGSQPPGSALWVDAQLPTPLGAIGAQSSYFSYDVLTAPQTDPSISGTVWGWTRDANGGRVDGSVRIPGAAPTAALVNRALVISSADAPPGLLLGQPVTSASDYAKFVAADAAVPGDGGFVLVNRVTGDVQLFRVDNGVPVLIPGGGERVLPPGATPTGPPGTRTVSLDLAAVERELGLPDDPSELSLSVDRALTLADGSIVTATGAAATVASLEAVGTSADGAATPNDVVESVDGASSDNVPVALVVASAVLALVVVGGAAVAVLFSRRRRRRHESLLAEGWFDRDLAARPVRPIGSTAESRSLPEFAAQAVAQPETTAPPPSPAVPPADVEPERVLDLNEAEAEHARANGKSHGASADATNGDGPDLDEADARATQNRALEELEAQFADLVQRVDRLGTGRDRS